MNDGCIYKDDDGECLKPDGALCPDYDVNWDEVFAYEPDLKGFVQ